MKQIAIFYALLALPVMGWGQLVEGKEIDKDPAIKYITLNVFDLTEAKPNSKDIIFEYFVRVSYGQNFGTDAPKPEKMELAEGDVNKRRFVSPMEIFNYFAGFGWEFVQILPEGKYDQYMKSTSYLFKKRG